ncbi:MAG: hypothetical protein IPI52_07030 [Bacteroidetes bacterium]|nr:hypothetical protein [Bacteroidota bacterium]
MEQKGLGHLIDSAKPSPTICSWTSLKKYQQLFTFKTIGINIIFISK